MKVDLVVAKYQEDISWIYEFPFNKFVYDKSDNGNLPNIGRESHTYLYHIINNYERIQTNPENITIFTQGNISDHNINIDDILTESIKFGHSKPGENNKNHLDGNFRISEWNGKKLIQDDLNFGDWFCKHTHLNCITYPFFWWCYAIFSIKNKYITTRPKEYYEELLKLHTENNMEICHYMERSWFYIFNCHPTYV